MGKKLTSVEEFGGSTCGLKVIGLNKIWLNVRRGWSDQNLAERTGW